MGASPCGSRSRVGDGRRRFASLITTLGPDVERTVPLTPLWRVRDVVAHVIGVGEDLVASRFPDFSDPKGQPEQALRRERWTQQQVERRRGRPLAALLDDWESTGREVEVALASPRDDPRYPFTSRIGATFDLACHLHDVRHAVGRPGDRDAEVTGVAFWMARAWLGLRLQSAGLGAVRLSTPTDEWVVGEGEPIVGVTAEAFELFRSLSGRRSRDQLLAMDWTGDPQPLLDVLSPYPFPEARVEE